MARLGIDFGTTNTVVVLEDRGVFSTVMHASETGAGTIVQELCPSAILLNRTTGECEYGITADRRFLQRGLSQDHVFIPSIKRQLRDYAQGRVLDVGSVEAAGSTGGGDDINMPDITSLLTGFLRSLGESVRLSRGIPDDEPLESVIAWPANANGAQRHVTRRCFRDAGFDVVETLNEPTASAIELADCLTAGGRRTTGDSPHAVAVFDLGGGTFDSSIVWIEGDEFHVLASGGIEDLGGDDFDEILLDMYLETCEFSRDDLGSLTRQALLRQARMQKEALSANIVRSLVLNPSDFGLPGRPVSISVKAYMDRVKPLIQPAIKMLSHVIKAASKKESRVKPNADLTVYLVGGSSKLPLVVDMIATQFSRSKVVLTDKPFTSVAMGAAICATDRVTYRDVFSRHFGVIRLKDYGENETFDTIFPAGTPIPRRGEPALEKAARYHPSHNIGHLRYLECASLGLSGMPEGGVRAWSDIMFPYDPALPLHASLSPKQIAVSPSHASEPVCEVYRCDSDGVITVELRRPCLGDARTYEIFEE